MGIKEVIENGYCIGCGVCAYLKPEALAITLNKFGQYEASIKDMGVDLSSIDSYCPFSDDSLNENELGEKLFPNSSYQDTLGFIHTTYAGHVVEGSYRSNGSSGGLGSWLAIELLKSGRVDAIIHAKTSNSTELFFQYGISETVDEILENAKSKYYPVKMDEVLQLVKKNKAKYLFVGIPCMVKSLRLLMQKDAELQESIVLTLGLVCGHIKSKSFAEMLGWQLGVPTNKLAGIDFRTKLKEFGANQYGVTVLKSVNDGVQPITSPPVNELFGTNWGLGYFKSKACDFCDDVTAETADITIGDAWLPEYVHDTAGTNILIVRNREVEYWIQAAALAGRIHLEVLKPERVIKSQQSGINHRRDGLKYRLYLNHQNSILSPQKRVQPSGQFPSKFKRIQELRVELRDKSHKYFYEAKELNNWAHFVKQMEVLNQKYAQLYKTPFYKRVLKKLKRMIS